jgi:SOS-response transcriptional repressor LexA
MKASPLVQWIKTAVTRVGGQAELARRISKELHRDIDRAAVNKMTLGTRQIAADELLAVEAVSGLPVPSPNVPAPVPLIEWVAAGKLTEPRSQIPVEDVPLLAFADLGSGEWFALKVRGDSMDRVSPEDSVIVVNRADKGLINGKCYVFSLRGETTYKRWQGGDPPYLEPYSTNPVNKPEFVKKKKDFEIIGRVKRTVLDL